MNKNVLKINHLYDSILSAAIGINERKKLNRFISRDPVQYEKYSKQKAKEWLQRWSELGKTKDVFYRYYSRFIGESPDIVPDDIMHNVIEPLLNPMRFRGLYADKNMFDKLLKPFFNKPVTPQSPLRCINGGLYDEEYYPIDSSRIDKIITECDADYLVAKPTIDTSSGKNVLFFDRKNDRYYLRGCDEVLDAKLLYEKLGKHFVVQKGLRQSEAMGRFNPCSINTLRISTYKSVESEEAVVLNGAVRIGKAGSYTDNVHSGGCRVGISPDGILKPSCSDQFGNSFIEFNGIDFSKQEFIIPNWNKVKEFAKNIAACLPHQRILALDIALDCNDEPCLIEYNNYAFTVSAFQMTVGTVFGQYTDEVIEYCKKHQKEATRIYLTY